MREILFRGQTKSDKKWIYGNLLQTDNGTYVIQNYAPFDGIGKYEVDPETLCQHTGLTDKNGRKIFEVDIINDIDYGIMKCIYLHGSFVWYKEDGFRIECMKYVPVIEVIGNIFDNPELIGDQP